MAVQTFTAVIYKEDDLYIAECPEIGTVSQGYTIEESPLPDMGCPLVTSFEATYDV